MTLQKIADAVGVGVGTVHRAIDGAELFHTYPSVKSYLGVGHNSDIIGGELPCYAGSWIGLAREVLTEFA